MLLASHTGSGKTLAYLLPLVRRGGAGCGVLKVRLLTAHAAAQIERLKQQEDQQGTFGKPRRPRALVLGPTRELTDQILRVAKGLSHHAKFRAVCVNGGGPELAALLPDRQTSGRLKPEAHVGLSPSQQRDALAKPVDLVIGTPQKVAQHAEAGNLFYGDVQVSCVCSCTLPCTRLSQVLRLFSAQLVVLDEADTLLEKGFKGEVETVLRPLRSKAQPATCTLVVATFTKVRAGFM